MSKTACFLSTLTLALYMGCSTIPEKEVGLTYTRTVTEADLSMPERNSVAKRPLVYPRSQLKYGLFQNYINWWIDRPLFFRRSIRKYPEGTFQHTQKESYIREIDIIKQYEVDGLANIATSPGHLRMYKEADGWVKEVTPKNYTELPEFGFGAPLSDKNYYLYRDTLQTAVDSPYSARINGKVLISSYVADKWQPEQIKELLTRLKNDVSKDFLFVSDLTITISRFHRDYKSNNHTVSPKAAQEFRQKVKAYLKTTDGIYLSQPPKTRQHDKTYVYEYDKGFVKNYLIPTLLELLPKGKKNDKLLGLGAKIAYINHRSGINLGEFGTETLRNCFETALKAKPDFIILPEWDEVNENTCFQPTVMRSLSTQRIMKYYMRKLKGEKPTPNKGDDLSIPNLIISTPRTVKLGEPIRIELLNIPDSDENTSFSAKLLLKSPDGQIIKAFPLETFKTNTMKAITYTIASESIANEQVLIPVLETTNTNDKKAIYDNLLYIRVTPTYCWNYQFAKQPLRDLLKPEKVNFKVNNSNGIYQISADVSTDEKIASVEVLDNGYEAYAFDKNDEFNTQNDVTFSIAITSPNSKKLNGKLQIKGTNQFKLRASEAANMDFYQFKKGKNSIQFNNQRINSINRRLFLTLPKSDLNKTTLLFDLSYGKFTVSANALLKNGIYGESLRDRLFILIKRMDSPPDIPVVTDSKNVSFSTSLRSMTHFPIFHLRVITESGKIYRSQPILTKHVAGPKETLNIFSETAGKVVSVDILKNRIPNLKYQFTPVCGDILPCKWGLFWAAELGGGFKYIGPFNRNKSYPENAKHAAPKWQQENGKWILNFDGTGNYINFPREAFPRGSFTLEFDALPESGDSRVLFRHRGHYVGSLVLKLIKNKLHAAFTDSELKTTDFDTGLRIKQNQWNSFKVSYNLKAITFSVNNKRKSFSFSRRALFLKPAVFGGDTKKEFGIKEDMKYFKGKLKKFRIYQNAE